MSFKFDLDFITPKSREPMTIDRIGDLLTKMDDQINAIDNMVMMCDDIDESLSLACAMLSTAKTIFTNCLTKEQYGLVIGNLTKDK